MKPAARALLFERIRIVRGGSVGRTRTMLRWLPLILLAACDRHPMASHSIRYDIDRALVVEVNLDTSSLHASVQGKASRRTLDAATTKSLSALAACAANEEQPPDFEYMAGGSELVLNDGARRTRIDYTNPWAGECTSALQTSLAALVGWKD
ncbi:MAG TPA: hypothetical protein VGM90_37335 [Kofleriaceae bacterium]|jgi:hypothetical protein